MTEEEEKIIRQVKTMLENATPFDMPPSRYNALETMVNLIEKQQKLIEIKDKMIDLMAEKIFRDITDKKMKKAYGIDSKEDVKKMYFNILDEEF